MCSWQCSWYHHCPRSSEVIHCRSSSTPVINTYAWTNHSVDPTHSRLESCQCFSCGLWIGIRSVRQQLCHIPPHFVFHHVRCTLSLNKANLRDSPSTKMRNLAFSRMCPTKPHTPDGWWAVQNNESRRIAYFVSSVASPSRTPKGHTLTGCCANAGR
jgi:hypothetical protein